MPAFPHQAPGFYRYNVNRECLGGTHIEGSPVHRRRDDKDKLSLRQDKHISGYKSIVNKRVLTPEAKFPGTLAQKKG